MSRKLIFIFLLVFTTCIIFTGYLKGCNSTDYPRQFSSITDIQDSSLHFVPLLTDSVIKVTIGAHYQKSKFHNLIYGTHYRDLWALPVNVKVFDIGKDKGGFQVLKKGGSMQTLNLRLKSNDGKEYVLRSIDKNQSNALPSFLRNKVFSYIIKDQTAALNPFGAFMIPRLAEASGVFHTNPELVFVPYDTRFGQYASLFEGRAALLEEYPDKSWIKEPMFKGSHDIISTKDMLANRYHSHHYSIDQKAFIKARLFDILVNDWDRHVDQWKWAAFKKEKETIYKPIPRDRDAAFFKFNSGLIPHLVLIFNSKFQSFDKDYDRIKGIIKNARKIDQVILNSTSEKEFIDIAKEIKSSITDTIIIEAVKSLPEEVFALIGNNTIQILKSRRDQLESAAKRYYQLLFEKVDIVGTDEKEFFFITRIDNTRTSVTVKTNKDKIIYQHTFDHHITKEIHLYGLDGNDEFNIQGKVQKGILIKVFGGHGYDKIKDESLVKGYRKKTKLYDSKNENQIELSNETEDLTSDDPHILYYDRIRLNKK